MEAGLSRARRLLRWIDRVTLSRKVMVALALAAVISGIATYAILTDAPPPGKRAGSILPLLITNLVLLLVLAAVVARRLVAVWVTRRKGLAGSRLHVRLVALFSLVAVVPTIIVAVFSYLFLSLGLDVWFSERVQTALEESLAVGDAYLKEHQQVIRGDILAMAADLNRNAFILQYNPQRLAQFVEGQARLRSLQEVVITDASGRRVWARYGLAFSLEYAQLPDWAVREAENGDVVVMTGKDEDRVHALVALDGFPDAFLHVGRYIEPHVLQHVAATQRIFAEYQQVAGQRQHVQITFALVYLLIAMLILLAAIWVGIIFATQLANPIGGLIETAERVRSGDLSARAEEGEGEQDFASLSRAFNRMTSQVQSQQRELIAANEQLDQRRRFTETVLAGVSAGVIGLDRAGRVNLPNRSASLLLGTELEHRVGEELAVAVPEMAELFAEASRRPDRRAQSQIQITRRGRAHVLLVRIAAEQEGGEVKGYVVTFDEVTELLAAQRKAAWADVARRIAHEIKNPLTPIQLSAERLRRKYLREITSDPETFSICTDTIIRHVEDIGRMVDEFSSFARMPAPVIKPENLVEICRQALFLQRNAHLDIDFDLVAPDISPPVACDARLVGQALTNLLKNAAESIQGRLTEDAAAPRGRIVLRMLAEEGGGVAVAVEDNGKGLPERDRDRLTEPYVTTRAKGTGLGLAIVKKIMEEHGGGLTLDDRPGGGAIVRLSFAAAGARTAAAPERATAAAT